MRTTAVRILLTLALMWECFASVARCEPAKRFEGPYHIKITASQTVRATVKSTRSFPDLVAQEWRAAFPIPPEFDGQPIARVYVTITGAPFAEFARATDEGDLRQPLVALHWFPDNLDGMQNITAHAIYEATITRRGLEPGEPVLPVPLLSRSERSILVAPTPHCDFLSDMFQAWLVRRKLTRKSGERDLEFAYRAMETMIRTYTYRYVPTSDRSASAVCAAGWSDCGGLSSVYASILRANDIPARCLAGIGLKSNRTHVKVDFYAEGVGWVPADPSAAVGSRSADVGFGCEHGDMVITHFDRIRLMGVDRCNMGGGVVVPQNAKGSFAGMTLESTRFGEVLSGGDRPSPANSQAAESQTRKTPATRRRRHSPSMQ